MYQLAALHDCPVHLRKIKARIEGKYAANSAEMPDVYVHIEDSAFDLFLI
jgi:hypothetical protein